MADSDNQEQKLLITQAKAGMVLARPVTLPNKISLCGAGTELTDNLIQRFIVRGIKRVFVKGMPLASHHQQAKAIQIENLHHRFSRVQDSAIMRYLENAMEEIIKERP